MSTSPSWLTPFRIRSFRFQWPADLATSWAFEMETLILGWYVLVETGSVALLAAFGSLLSLGTLISPMFGVMGDRIGHRNVLCAMRAIYAILAAALMTFSFLGMLTPVHVFVISLLMGLVRPSDLVMRNSLVGETIPATSLTAAMGISRTTADSARIAGALAGAGIVALLGMGPAYLVITGVYVTSFLLTLGVGNSVSRPVVAEADLMMRSSPWRDLRDAIGYVWSRPDLLAALLLAFLVNLTAFPIVNGLLPYVAKDIYQLDRTGLGYLVAGFASGALMGSIATSIVGAKQPARMVLVFSAAWYAFLLVFVQMQHVIGGFVFLFLSGFVQSVAMILLAVVLLRVSDPKFRGRVMGMRMLAVYGLPIGLLLAGPLIAQFGYVPTTTSYCLFGLVFTALIALRWRSALWRADAPANA